MAYISKHTKCYKTQFSIVLFLKRKKMEQRAYKMPPIS